MNNSNNEKNSSTIIDIDDIDDSCDETNDKKNDLSMVDIGTNNKNNSSTKPLLNIIHNNNTRNEKLEIDESESKDIDILAM